MGAQWKHKGRLEHAAAKGKLFGKLAKEVIMAAKGGADPDKNSRLRLAIEQAKKASMPRDTLERAIKKGAGLLDEQVTYEVVTYEGFGPHQVPVIVECLTDNRTRTATNIRTAFRGGQLAASGAVSWDFKRQGVIEATHPANADPEEAAIDAGAQDLEVDQGVARFFTEPTDLDAVQRALAGKGWAISAASLQWISKNPVALDATKRSEVERFLEGLDEDDDVQNLYVGMK